MATQNTKKPAVLRRPSTKSSSSQPKIQPATLVSSQSHVQPGRLLVTELCFTVPLDHADPNGEKLDLFCRAARRHEVPVGPMSEEARKHLPYMVYIPGGPGMGCPPPQDMLSLTNFFLDKGYQMLYFDHRGMGLSSPITAQSITSRGSPTIQAAYLKFFRAPHAVRDLEAMRLCLTAANANASDHPSQSQKSPSKWSVIGQSYGGYLITTYLSTYPSGLAEAFLLFGLPPIYETKPDNPIQRLMTKVKSRNEVYYTKYPEDVRRVKQIVEYLGAAPEDIRLPSGGRLGKGRFLEMGLHFGFHGGIDMIHNMVLRCARELDLTGFLSRPTLGMCDRMTWFDEHILYAVLHEALYLQGHVEGGSDWAFDRLIRDDADFGAADIRERYLFTGEMVFRGAFGSYAELQPLTDVMELLMREEEWDRLYDDEVLRRNEVPVFAAVSLEDMYVDSGYSLETAKVIRGCRTMVTNLMYHDASRAMTEELLKGLWGLREDVID